MKKTPILLASLILLATCTSSFGQNSLDFDELNRQLEQSLSKLDSQREAEGSARNNLGGEVAKLERKLLEMRRKRSLARMSHDGRHDLINKLEGEKLQLEKDAQYMGKVYREFAVQLENHTLIGQRQLYQESINAAIESTSSLEQQSSIIDAAIDRLDSLIGGEELSAEATSTSGLVLQGTTINIGPSSWFYSPASNQAGAIFYDENRSPPRIVRDDSAEITKLFTTGSANLSIDVTGGKARAIEQIQGNAGSFFQKGGVWLWIILSIALLATVCGICKLVQLIKIKEPQPGWIGDVLVCVRKDDIQAAKDLTNTISHPVGNLLNKAIEYSKEGADVVEEVVYEQLIGVQSQLQKWLPFIAVTAATAPLLGLLGTVSGMIRMFNVITITGTGDVKPMAGGISEALITTLFGLIVAIPALILHTILSRKSNSVVQNTEKMGLSFVNGLRKIQ